MAKLTGGLMTRKEKVHFILGELSGGESDRIPENLVEMISAKSDRCLDFIVRDMKVEKRWLKKVEQLAS